MTKTLPLAGALALTLAACAPTGDPDVSRAAPPDAAPGVCYGRDVSPAVIETVTEQVVLEEARHAEDGTLISPAVYETVTRQAIVEERRELWFETPCERDLTPDFIASLQRALAVRGYYDGPAHGRVTDRTRRAVRAFQSRRGLDSAVLSIDTARALGLIAFDAGEAGAGAFD